MINNNFLILSNINSQISLFSSKCLSKYLWSNQDLMKTTYHAKTSALTLRSRSTWIISLWDSEDKGSILVTSASFWTQQVVS